MKDTTSINKSDKKSRVSYANSLLRLFKGNIKTPISIGVLILVAFIIIVCIFPGGKSGTTRTETYREISGAAGLEATIDYDAQCSKQPCKQTYDFNVYILRDDGQQVGVVRPDTEGKVNMALPEGNYVMIIGRQFGKDKLFPQEPLALKNGKALELKLHYK